jgi:hypothetical protein
LYGRAFEILGRIVEVWDYRNCLLVVAWNRNNFQVDPGSAYAGIGLLVYSVIVATVQEFLLRSLVVVIGILRCW